MPVSPAPESVDRARRGLFGDLRQRLTRSRAALADGLGGLLGRGRHIDAALLEEIEDTLLAADVGVEATRALLAGIRDTLAHDGLDDAAALRTLVRERLLDIVRPCARPLVVPPVPQPFVILVVGVNGVGKTTTIAKLAASLKRQGHNVLLAAADTFRAAAIEQLQDWGRRHEVPVIAQQQGADAAAVAHDALAAARARGADVLIIDTAGRQHTHAHLMAELIKIKQVVGRLDATAPHEVLLVLDAGTGQNALAQLKHFGAAVGVTGLCLTKLDGTAKGGILFALAGQGGLPVRYIGVGEKVDDLRPFDAAEFVDALFGDGLGRD